MSNNVAEYAALCEVLRVLLRDGRKDEPVEVRSDSRLLVNQMSGNWKFRKGIYAEKYREAVGLTTQFTELSFKWVPREENEEADALTREAYSKARVD